MLRSLSILICFIFFTAGPMVWANEQIAKKLFREGTMLFERKDYTAAAKIFRQAYNEEPNWRLFYNIGQSEAAARHHGRAMEAFELYLSQGGDEVPQGRLEEIEDELDRLRRLVGFVDINAPDGAKVVIDDDERGVCPLPGRLMVAAGVVHNIRIIYNDRELVNRALKVSGTQSITIDAVDDQTQTESNIDDTTGSDALNNIESSSAIAAGNENDSNTHIKTEKINEKPSQSLIPIGISLMAAGGAGIVGGIITGAIALKKAGELENNCQSGVCLQEYHDDNNTKESIANASTILFVSGAAIAVTGTILFISGKKKIRRSQQQMTVLPSFYNNSGILFFSGRF